MRHIDNPSSANIMPSDCIVATPTQRAALSIGPEDAGKVIVEKSTGRMYLATMTEGAKSLSANLAAELAEIGGITSEPTLDQASVIQVMAEGPGAATYRYGEIASQSNLIHIPLLGQSNMVGDQSFPVLSWRDTGFGNLMFSRGVATWSSTDNPTAPASRVASGFALVPLVAGASETRANAFADSYKCRALRESRFSAKDLSIAGPHVFITASGLGGRKLTELGPENHAVSGHIGGHWPTMFDDISRARVAAENAGLGYMLPFWCYDQGESEGDLYLYYQGSIDTITNVRSGYKSRALTMVSEFSTRASAVVKQPRQIPCIVVPPSSTLVTASPWLELSNESNLVFLVGPRYVGVSALMSSSGTGAGQTWGSNIHLAPDSHRWIGEQTAKVAYRIFNDAEDWKPLQAIKALKIDANNVDVTFNVPRPPLVIDTELIAKYNGFGFSMWSGSLDAPTGRQYATGAAIQADGRTVRVTFGSSVPAGAKLSLGITSASDIGSTPAILSTGTGANTPDGFSTHTVTFAGDIRSALSPISQEGAFYLRVSGALVECVIRSVAFDATNTILTGETREIRSGGGYRAPAASDSALFGRAFAGLNIRDSDSSASINIATYGPLAGKPYPLHNWCCQYDGLVVQGA